jgi:hypothetical protein
MQFAKDSFFLALQERLAGLNPARTVTLNGAMMPAIVVVENLPPNCADCEPNTFYLQWGTAEVLSASTGCGTLISVEVVISYYTSGSAQSMVDRGRVLAQLGSELLSICRPPNTEKRDYTQSPSADLGTRVFWSQPAFGEPDKSGLANAADAGGRVARQAQMKMYFWAEVTAL